MPVGKPPPLLSLIILLIGWLVSLATLAQQHTDFIPLSLPSPHLLEAQVTFGQDAHGQVWLVTEHGLSVYRDGQFHSYRRFDVNDAIIGGVFQGDVVFLATASGLYRLSLATPSARLSLVWAPPVASQAQGSDPILSLSAMPASNTAEGKPNATVLYVQTRSALFRVLSSRLAPAVSTSGTEARQIHSLADPQALMMRGLDSGLMILANRQLSYFSELEASWQSLAIPIDVTDMAVFEQAVYVVDDEGQLYVGDPFGWVESQGFTRHTFADRVTGLLVAQDGLYARSGDYLVGLQAPGYRIKDASQSDARFVDASNNIWLGTPHDIQVAWWQPVAARTLSSVELEWAKREASVETKLLDASGRYGLTNDTLMARKDRGEPWKPLRRLQPMQGKVRRLMSTEQHLWLVSPHELKAVDKQTLTFSYSLPLSKDALVLPFDRQQVLVASQQQVISVSGTGRIDAIKTQADCPLSCLPDYRVYDFLLGQSLVWLGTDRGLHHFSLADMSFSQERSDGLNQLSPVMRVLADREQRLWLVYPNRVASFQIQTGTSALYYSPLNRIFDARINPQEELLLHAQRGWLSLSLPRNMSTGARRKFVVQQVLGASNQEYLSPIHREVVLAQAQDELHLAFNLGKQHPAQSLMIRYKYEDDKDWILIAGFEQGLRLSNLRQGANRLQLQARLEGQNWQHSKTVAYVLPYRFFQTKWVLSFVAVFLLILVAVVAYERFKRVQMMFNSIKQQAFISSLLESTREGVWIANKDREIQSVNQAFMDITGYSVDDVAGRSFQLMSDQGRNHEVESLIWQEVIKSGFWSGEVWTKRRDGDKVSLDLSVTRVESENKMMGKIDVKFVGVFSDVTARKRSERDLRQLATRDPLTGLVNRTLFIEQIKHCIDTTGPDSPHFALMFLDLDNFKKINESLGPLRGDEFIGLVAKRLQLCLPKGISLARLGGDEFGLLISSHLFSGVPAFYIKRIATDIQRELQPAFYLDGTEVSITASIGVSIFPTHGDSPELLMRCADTAMNRVKISGRNNCLIFDHVMDDLVDDKLSLESELICAIQNDEFLVYYQPKYKIQQNQICGFEALVRWNNPNRGLVSPEQFIRIAEDNGLIRQLDYWVLRQVCRQIKQWLQTDTLVGKVAVNLSALNFQQSEFCQSLLDLIAEEGELLSYIELEITETAMMRDPERALDNIKTLKSKGLTIALDDFGTGHSSLGYLKHFPIDRLKIDRTFVKDIEYSAQDRNIAGVIIQLAKHLGIQVIAEGVESEMQAYLLHVMGCNEIQGYLISRPILSEQVAHFMAVEAQKLQQIARVSEP